MPEFEGGESIDGADKSLITGIDHVNLAHPWQTYDEAVLFYSSVLALTPGTGQDVAAPTGLVRSQVMGSRDGSVRLALNVAPLAARHGSGQRPGAARGVLVERRPVSGPGRRRRGVWSRCRSRPTTTTTCWPGSTSIRSLVEQLAAYGAMYDRDDTGEFVHFYTATVGGLFLEVVERRGGYQGYGAPNAPSGWPPSTWHSVRKAERVSTRSVATSQARSRSLLDHHRCLPPRASEVRHQAPATCTVSLTTSAVSSRGPAVEAAWSSAAT